jgi:hypothetical protein
MNRTQVVLCRPLEPLLSEGGILGTWALVRGLGIYMYLGVRNTTAVRTHQLVTKRRPPPRNSSVPCSVEGLPFVPGPYSWTIPALISQ